MNEQNNKKYFTIALYSFLVILAVILVTFFVLKFDSVKNIFNAVITALSPVLLGLIFAYILNPLLSFFEFKVYKKVKPAVKYSKIRRALSIISVSLCVVAFFALLIGLFVPQLIESYNSLVSKYGTVESAITSITDSIKHNELLAPYYDVILDILGIDAEHGNSALLSFIYETLTNIVKEYAIPIANGVYNAIIALIFCIYVLVYRERLSAITKKLFYSLLKKNHYDQTAHATSVANRNFGIFIRGKLLDSSIIFLMSYIVYGFMGLEFFPVLALITGVFNIIPYFGPVIGAIPVSIIVLIAQPEKTIWVLVVIILIQLIDANFMYPMILGDSFGLPSVWIILSTLVFGGLFGFAGMILGVPLFATAYTLIREKVDKRLAEKGLDTATELYYSPEDPSPDTETEANEPEKEQSGFWSGVLNAIKKLFTKK